MRVDETRRDGFLAVHEESPGFKLALDIRLRERDALFSGSPDRGVKEAEAVRLFRVAAGQPRPT